jgi:L-asparaginase
VRQKAPALCAAAQASAAALCSLAVEAGLPRVRLIATGGTIANHPAGRLDAVALTRTVPGLAARALVEPETFSSTASLGLTLEDWVRLARRVSMVLEDPRLAGVVITTGTDTLEELAWFLDLTRPGDRPVVVTGAMRRPTDPDPDGPRNLRDAVTVAASPDARGRGALVVMHGHVLRARSARKAQVSASGGFDAPGEGPLATVEDGTVVFAGGAGHRPEPAPFDLDAVGRLPRVDILLTYQDAPGDLIGAAVESGARGLVLASAGLGSMTPAQAAAVAQAQRRGVVVVAGSRIPAVSLTDVDVAGVVAAGTLTPVKARILLMLGLAQGRSRDEIAALFARYGS